MISNLTPELTPFKINPNFESGPIKVPNRRTRTGSDIRPVKPFLENDISSIILSAKEWLPHWNLTYAISWLQKGTCLYYWYSYRWFGVEVGVSKRFSSWVGVFDVRRGAVGVIELFIAGVVDEGRADGLRTDWPDGWLPDWRIGLGWFDGSGLFIFVRRREFFRFVTRPEPRIDDATFLRFYKARDRRTISIKYPTPISPLS